METGLGARSAPLFWFVVKRRALVHNMNRYELERLVADYFECSMSDITTIDASGACRYRHLLAIGRFDRPALNEVKCLFTMMDVQEARVPRLHLLDARNDLHIGTGQVRSL